MPNATVHKVVGVLHGKAIFSRRTRVLADGILPLFPQDARVLDVGTGDGTIASLWQRNRPDLRIEGIDLLVRNNTKISVRAFDGHSIPFANKTWDVVSFVDVLHHTDCVEHLLREAARVACSYVIVKDHFAENRIDRVTLRFMDWVGNAPHAVALPYNYLSRVVWKDTFRRAQVELQSLEEHVPLYQFPFSFVFGRGLHFIAKLRPLI